MIGLFGIMRNVKNILFGADTDLLLGRKCAGGVDQFLTYKDDGGTIYGNWLSL